jgi:hypothetical protein
MQQWQQLSAIGVASVLVVFSVAFALSKLTKPAPVAPVTHSDSFAQRFVEDSLDDYLPVVPRAVRTERYLAPVAEAASPEPRSASRVGGTADICERHRMVKVWVSKTRWRCRRSR